MNENEGIRMLNDSSQMLIETVAVRLIRQYF